MNRVCLDCGTLTNRTRCPDCRRHKDRQRGSRQQRGYNRGYDQARRAWAVHVAAGTTPCCFCGELIVDNQFDLDHDHGLRPAHPSCNRAAGARKRFTPTA